MKVLVTGGGGFLGTRITELLVARGDCVRVLGRRRYPHLESLGAECVAADIRDADRQLVAADNMLRLITEATHG